MLSFGVKNNQAFGLDISSASIKLLQLRGEKKQTAVDCYGLTALPKGAMVNDIIADRKTFSYLIKEAVEKPALGRVASPYAVVSLPESKSFVRVIQIPKMSEQEANNAVPFEAENFIPLPLDQVYMDWQKVSDQGDPSRLGQAEAGKMNVLIIATPKNYADSLLEVLDSAGVTPIALEVESQSCHRALIAKTSAETSLIVNIGSKHSNIIMVERGGLQFTSTIPIAGAAFTDIIAKNLGVSMAKAQEIKDKVGIGNTVEYPNIKTATLPVLNTLSAEIKNILKFHSEHSDLPVSTILLAGGGSKLKNLAEFLGDEFKEYPNLQVKTADPWANVPNLKSRLFSTEDSLIFTTAIGLAMRGANL